MRTLVHLIMILAAVFLYLLLGVVIAAFDVAGSQEKKDEYAIIVDVLVWPFIVLMMALYVAYIAIHTSVLRLADWINKKPDHPVDLMVDDIHDS